MIDDATWQARKADWLPSAKDREAVAALMVPEFEAGKFASWIAAPQAGINEQPVEFDYVHLQDEALA